MRAVVMTAAGGPDVLVAQDLPDPEPAAGEVLVRTEAAGVHFVETQMRRGLFPIATPHVFGTQAAGVIVDVGPGVDADWIGVRVVISTLAGAYAELVTVAQDSVTPIPDELTTITALGVMMQGSVALTLVEAARIGEGETVLVEAAATGIGGYLVQLLADSPVGRVLKTTSPGRHTVPDAIDHTAPHWIQRLGDSLNGESIDVVFESGGGEEAAALLDLMTPLRGRMLYYGMRSGAPAAITAQQLMMSGLTVTGCSGPAWHAAVARARPRVLDLAASGKITPLIDVTLPLDQAAHAHQRIESRHADGMVMLVP